MARPRKHAHELLYQGQAGVWAVASKLALLGHLPMFPGIDIGYDLMLSTGIKIQVKTASLVSLGEKRYPFGAYHFHLRRASWYGSGTPLKIAPKLSYEEVADFFILWGIDEDRFFIIPTKTKKHCICFARRGSTNNAYNRESKYRLSEARAKECEDRWELLSLDSVKGLVETAYAAETPSADGVRTDPKWRIENAVA